MPSRHGGHHDEHHDDHRDEHRGDHRDDHRDGYRDGAGPAEWHEARHGRHAGLDPHALRRDLLRRVLANRPLVAALAGGAVLVLALATWLLVTIVGAVGQGGLRAIVEPVAEGARTIWEGTGKPALPR